MRALRWIVSAVVILALPAIGQAQTDQGKVAGTVRDSSGAFVAGATITVRNEKTGEQRIGVSNESGGFLIGNLRPSTYAIRVEKPGFGPVAYTDMIVAVGQELSLDFEFRPAGVQEAITVVGSAPVLDVSSATMGVNVSEREV